MIEVLASNLSFLQSRFVMSLCIPAIEMLLHTIIAELLCDDVKLFKASDKMRADKTATRHIMSATFWTWTSRVILPVAYVVVALAIVLPGVLNVAINI